LRVLVSSCLSFTVKLAGALKPQGASLESPFAAPNIVKITVPFIPSQTPINTELAENYPSNAHNEVQRLFAFASAFLSAFSLAFLSVIPERESAVSFSHF
jgi:hypothetical protein